MSQRMCKPHFIITVTYYWREKTYKVPEIGSCSYQYTGCPRRNVRDFGRVFLMLNYTDITQNTYIQSWTVTEIMAIEKCGLLGCPRTVRRPWRHTHPLRMPGNETPLANSLMQWPWRDNGISCGLRKVLGNPKDNYDVSVSVLVVQFNGFMSLTSYFDVKYRY